VGHTSGVVGHTSGVVGHTSGVVGHWYYPGLVDTSKSVCRIRQQT
jgi:hypothetical protein